jgi:hypothetical protein
MGSAQWESMVMGRRVQWPGQFDLRGSFIRKAGRCAGSAGRNAVQCPKEAGLGIGQ